MAIPFARSPSTTPPLWNVPSTVAEGNVPEHEFLSGEYQVQLFEIAVKENTIVCLGPRSGKKFLSLMLIKEYEAAV
ncbi:hypothetical protein HPB50_010748 [Hyalomma asiaticum]|uniref:Uncharacterized protein n=1 Tax=Hyalomma asiaticum TaxID=266040 RepID=A0ACB7TFS6_HYAAI|nr:hypothetical protein HPB50_010748 [Hyalomma asiaticum]